MIEIPAQYKQRFGFTLIELLVVIAVIGILAMVILVSLSNARIKARDTRRLTDMIQMNLAMTMYSDTHSYSYYVGTTFATYVTALQGTTPALIGATPVDPLNSGSNVYTALSGGSGTQYCFYTQLEQVTTQYSVASEAGAGKRSSVPSAQGGCGPNM